MKNWPVFALFSLVALVACNMSSDSLNEPLEYPQTVKVDHVDKYFEKDVPDPYRWLEDDMSDETADWVERQNEVTFDYLDRIDFRENIEGRLKELLDYERISSPSKEGDYTYFSKNDGLQNHAVIYRTRNDDPDGEPEVYLDPNTFTEDGTTALRGVFFTRDGSMSAHMITEGGSDWRKIIVMNTADKSIIEDTIVDVKFSGTSWKGNEGFYYSSYDNPENEDGSELSSKTQNHKLLYHKLGDDQANDQLIYGGDVQPNRYIGGLVTEDQRYLGISASQTTSGNQVHVMDLQNPGRGIITISDDYSARVSYLHNEGERFFFLTNIDAPKYRIVAVDLNRPSKEHWVEIIGETENVLTASCVGGKIFAEYLIDAKSAVQQFDLEGNFERNIELPTIGSASGFNGKSDDTELYYSFTSFTFPTTIYKYDVKSGESTIYRAPEVSFDPDDYETTQVFYQSKDGTRIPMFLVHKRGLELTGKNPTYLYGYGGFNISLTPSFSAFRVAWLENGGVYAQANLRGGGEYGKAWHKAGTKMQKQNVFDDFISAAEYLIAENYTSSDYLAIAGGSNGGLLVGATMTQRPDLVKVALPAVGVLDMLRYHTFTAGAGWADDYGTSEESPEMFEYLLKYSPYHALKPGVAYPATMVTTSDHDDRVVPAHSFKFASRLQEYHAGDAPTIIRIQTNAGHGSVSTEQQIAYASDIYAFAWANMGVRPEFSKEVLD